MHRVDVGLTIFNADKTPKHQTAKQTGPFISYILRTHQEVVAVYSE